MFLSEYYINIFKDEVFYKPQKCKKHFGVMNVVIETNIFVSPRMSTAQSPLVIMVIPT